MEKPLSGLRSFLIGVTLLGLLPGIVILVFLDFKDGQLVVMNQAISEYSTARLVAAVLSMMIPVLLILPLAMTRLAIERTARFWILAYFAPLLLLLPSLLAGILIGGTGLWPCLGALLLVGLFNLTFTLWMECLGIFFSPALTLLAYGGFWALSDYVEHLRLYVAPYLEIKILGVTQFLYWLVPQVRSGFSHIDDFLQSGQLQWNGLLPTLIQIPLAAAFLVIVPRLRAKRSQPGEGE